MRLGLPVLQPRRVRREGLCELDPLRRAQATVVVAYGQILPTDLCETESRPALNVHYSLLPDLRGAAPVQRALLGGRQTTGVTVQYVAEELDSGDILVQQEVTVAPEATLNFDTLDLKFDGYEALASFQAARPGLPPLQCNRRSMAVSATKSSRLAKIRQ